MNKLSGPCSRINHNVSLYIFMVLYAIHGKIGTHNFFGAVEHEIITCIYLDTHFCSISNHN